jgi:P63C domain
MSSEEASQPEILDVTYPEVFEATHRGYLDIAGAKIPCAVLKNGKRVISQQSLFAAFDRPRKGEKRQEGLPSVIGAKNLLPYVTNELREKCRVLQYYHTNGRIAAGHDAELIPLICDLYLDANKAEPSVLVDSQMRIVERAEILLRSLAKVGIIGLIDEATGYQYDREKDELQKLLSKYIAEEFLPWTSRFPRDYYREIFRLYGWEYDPLSLRRTPFIGKFTNDFVYNEMSPEVLKELRVKNPTLKKGRRRRKHHQHLTEEIGVPHLERHLTKLVTVMQLSDSIDDFKDNFKRAFKKTNQLQLDLERGS